MSRARRPLRRLARSRFWGIPLALLALEPAAQLRAQEEGPIVFTQEQRRQWFALQNTHAALELLYRQQTEDNNSKTGQPDTHFSEQRFEETLSLDTTGYIYHPNLVDLSMAGSFGLTQAEVEGTDQSDTESGTVYDWDLNATILRKEYAPLTLYSRRTRQLINRDFGPSLDTTITTTGAILDIRSKAVPTRLEVYHSDQEQSAGADRGVGDFTLAQNTFTWHSEYRPSTRQTWSWDYTFNNVDESTKTETGSVDNAFNTNDAALSHTINFGYRDRSNLTSTATFFNQTGDFSIERFRWDELLRLQHNDDLETRYQYTLNQQSYLESDELTNRGVFGFTHHLYKSLTTDGNVGIQQVERSDDANTFETFADIHWDYEKKVPYGKFFGFLGYAWDRQENDAQSQLVHVAGEQRTVSDLNEIIVQRSGVVPSSFIITDPTGVRVFRPNVDYTVRDEGDQVVIVPVPAGPIGIGDSVLLNYDVEPQAGNTATTNTFSVGGRYHFDRGALDGLSLYVRYTRQDQNIDTDNPLAFTPNSFTDVIYGAEYDIWHLTLGYEHETMDSTISPFDADRFSARWTERIWRETTFIFNGTYQLIDYPEEDNRVTLLMLSGQLSHSFTRELYGYATIVYRDETDDLRGPTRGWEEQLELQWHHRQTYVYGLIRNTSVETDFQDRSFQFIEIGIRREF